MSSEASSLIFGLRIFCLSILYVYEKQKHGESSHFLVRVYKTGTNISMC